MCPDCYSPKILVPACFNIGHSKTPCRYPTRPEVVALDSINLSLEPGQLVALVGLSGSGKSTLVALLQRLYDPTGGKVRELWLPCCGMVSDCWSAA